MKPNIGLSEKNTQAACTILTGVLADAVTLYTKTRKYHWNVKGESFMELHQLFEEHYKALEKNIDEIAERINKLGGNVIGTHAEFIKYATLKESPAKYPVRQAMLKDLLSDNEQVVKALRKHIDACDEKLKDAGTADFLTALLAAHETAAWTLRRYFN
jgi:starvation-inducible DNA-binding protein